MTCFANRSESSGVSHDLHDAVLFTLHEHYVSLVVRGADQYDLICPKQTVQKGILSAFPASSCRYPIDSRLNSNLASALLIKRDNQFSYSLHVHYDNGVSSSFR
jgi:hypothetical protein